jgi:hypothetical protein
MTVRRHRQPPSDWAREHVRRDDRASSARGIHPLPAGDRLLRAGRAEYTGIRRYKLLLSMHGRGYHTLGPAAGVDFTHLPLRDQLGLPVQQVTARPTSVDPAADRRTARSAILAGDTRVGPYLRSLRGIGTEAVFSPSDPLPVCTSSRLVPYPPPRGPVMQSGSAGTGRV